ncbi:MAG: hypothetical protein R8F63_08700 [Acidimicrobiales bacterium]|nr:hypothetical protein [Acidimicrobiales bacterium]
MDADSPLEPVALTPNDPLAGLADWIAEGRVDAAAADRARGRWLERQAQEDATLAGVLLDLAERGRPVAARTVGGRLVRGPVTALGADFLVIREQRLGDVMVPLGTLATVRAAPGDPPPVGARPVSFAIVLAEALVELAADRPTVVVAVAGEELRGELCRAGRDVVAVALTDQHREVVSIATAAIDHVIVLRH